MSAPSPGPRFGGSPVPPPSEPPTGRLVDDGGEPAYRIDGAEALAPFLMSVVSASNHWLFASSTGALTAGRRHPGLALFPYVTEDKIHDAAGVTGPATAILATRDGAPRLWRPLREDERLAWPVRRSLVKTLLGHRLAWEEENPALGLAFRAAWTTSDRHGFVRQCRLVNAGPGPVAVRLLDGLLNLLPADVDEQLQAGLSCLVDAYKRAERLPGTTLALFTLVAQVVDRPEPRESLHATTVWSHGLPSPRLHLDAAALGRFERGEPLDEPAEVRGRRGAYLAEATFTLPPGGQLEWLQVAEVAQPQRAVVALAKALADPAALAAAVRADAADGGARLRRFVAATDGLQQTADAAASAHHLANVLFNDLRGGLFPDGHAVPGRDLAAFVACASRATAARHVALLDALPASLPRAEAVARLEATGDPDLARLALEHLPLTFSRRHGDPSRPWNRFDIQVRDARGERRLGYQGNWRDIFQNWEALALSHPEFVEGMIARFADASTADGHNPYRISHRGLDWEVPEPGHPWSAIGYWGDHQLPYLLRLLELSRRLHPARLPALLERAIFTYADVPYELASWQATVADPRRTIGFDAGKHARLVEREGRDGADGRLLHARDAAGAPRGGEATGLHRVTLLEKLLVPALARLAAFVPGGGVWMTTGRPEWNDANNALVGWGVSVVTLCHLERYLAFLPELLAPLGGRATPLSPEVAAWAESTRQALARSEEVLARPEPTPAGRAEVMAALGGAATAYREALYRRGLSAPAPAPADALLDLVARALAAVRGAVTANRRPDGLYHAYNLLRPLGPDGFGLERLPEMLEGQVAALGTRLVGPAEACHLLDALRQSRLWREDQRSYLLYPDRDPPRFLEKNVVPPEALAASPLLARLAEAGTHPEVIGRDAAGRLRFGEGITGADRLREGLVALSAAGEPGVDEEAVAAALSVHEAVFHHHRFTGRSGSMFAYEGLGSIYWHMPAKLLLAVEEQALAAAAAGAPPELRRRLRQHAWAIRDGLGGLRKGPAAYGAFPLDPYSHTPRQAGARQPGMTGQVKEEILARLLEVGIAFEAGRIAFRPELVRREELHAAPSSLEALDAGGRAVRVALPEGSLGVTLCQVPVVIRAAGPGEDPRHEVTWSGGRVERREGAVMDEAASQAVLGRTGEVERVDAWVVLPT